MGLVTFLLAALAAWRLTHLLHVEEGPWRCLVALRAVARRAGAGAAIECFLCLSLWVTLPLAFGVARGSEALLAWPALSAAAILVERLVFPETFVPMPQFAEAREGEPCAAEDGIR